MDQQEQVNKGSMNCKTESKALEAILRNSRSNASVPQFFDSVYQEACVVFGAAQEQLQLPDGSTLDDPYTSLVRNGWDALIQLLEASRAQAEGQSKDVEDDSVVSSTLSTAEVLLFQNQASLGPDALAQRYNHSLFAAYLDGCSVITNHADTVSPYLARLCQDLQNSFPHAYANTYLTPPMTQSVPAHADDRDVLVIQIHGQKEWTVYQQIPCLYPYSHEQVGKQPHLPVPDSVLQGPVLLQCILKPGDVLYMPRGYVHMATALAGTFSFHVTIALATQDWSLANLVADSTRLLAQVNHRKAINRQFGTRPWNQVPDDSKHQLQASLDEIWADLKNQVTVQFVHETLAKKYKEHNERANRQRSLIHQQQQLEQEQQLEQQIIRNTGKRGTNAAPTVVGRLASTRVLLNTKIRAATDDEKDRLLKITSSSSFSAQPRGLQVSNECYDALIQVVTKIMQDSSLVCRVDQLHALYDQDESSNSNSSDCKDYLCELTWLALARRCVELGAFAVVE
jgi:ribosomal protein L16 Arg81 hydroxylase